MIQKINNLTKALFNKKAVSKFQYLRESIETPIIPSNNEHDGLMTASG